MSSARALHALAAVLVLSLPTTAWAADTGTPGVTLAQQSPDQWRASKLIGVSIYGPDNKSVGKITDVLIGHDGMVQDVVVGVGGFLGIGEKDVAIPLKAVNFTAKPMPVATAAPSNGASAPSPATTGMASPTPGLGTPADTLGAASNPPMGGAPAGAAAVPSTAYPQGGTIAYNVDQLKSAPAFKFAP